jgi:nitroimidazol reductase NimA-like FMN-containing flavoprotein (pyridoxamine 5'-phosphate oxidase superfamily)
VAEHDADGGTARELAVLSREECLAWLAGTAVGRIAVAEGGRLHVLPVNLRLVGVEAGAPQLVVRTVAGGVIDRARGQVAVEVDAFDRPSRSGWSVLVQGEVRHVDASYARDLAALDPDPWVGERTSWVVVDAEVVSGRRLGSADLVWPPGDDLPA